MKFAATPVLSNVSFALEPGVVHAIVGHNGAGKSTLMKIALGVHRPSVGEVVIGGKRLETADPTAARSLGLGMVFQEKSLIPTLNGLDNLFLNAEQTSEIRGIRRRAETEEALELCDRLGVSPLLLKRRVSELSAVEQQMLEIAKALRLASKALILDEPTAPLGNKEISQLFQVVRNVARHGTGVILITHHLAEVFEVSDQVTVLREGRITLSCQTSETDVSGLVKAMLGEEKVVAYRSKETNGNGGSVAMDVSGLQVRGKLEDVSFQLVTGEIAGLVGLAGSGRSTLMRTLFGDIRRDGGQVTLFGKRYRPRHPADAIRRGVYLVPESRAIHGLLLSKSIAENVALSILGRIKRWGFVRMAQGRANARRMMQALGIRARGPDQLVSELSGGNQQKVVVAKTLSTGPRLLLLDEPTYGVDVGAASDLAELIRQQAEAGIAVLWASSDIRELTEVADRILILADGVIRASVSRGSPQFTESALIEGMQRAGAQGVGDEA
jgi:ABC-type sugar transport system ATPase subunit